MLLALSTFSSWLAASPVFRTFSVHSCTVSQIELCGAFYTLLTALENCLHSLRKRQRGSYMFLYNVIFVFFNGTKLFARRDWITIWRKMKQAFFCKEMNYMKDETFSSIVEDISRCIVCCFDRETLVCMSVSIISLLGHVAFFFWLVLTDWPDAASVKSTMVPDFLWPRTGP